MLRYITSLQHPLVKHLVKLRQNRDYRFDHKSLVLEGTRPIAEVCRHLRAKVLVALDESLLPLGVEAEQMVLVSDNVMKKISGVQTPEGLVAEIPLPKNASLKGKRYLIALDGVSDPGNVGTLLRTALALGWEGAFILDESCDPFNEKALRAARGATFRLPLSFGNWDQLKQLVQENGLTPLAADLEGDNIEKVAPQNGLLLVLGNESLGISETARSFCKSVTIAMPGEMESLNVSVAGAIIMYILRNRR